MANRTKRALVIGLAGAFALAATSSSFAAPKSKYPKDSYEAWGLTRSDGVPPVPGHALSTYKPGMCWSVSNQNWQLGSYIPCSECKKLNAQNCPHN
jgi:hypothetical protein